MDKQKILITGINGFIGGYLSERLFDEGYEIHGLTQEDDAKTKGVIAHKGDLMEFDRIGKILNEVDPEFIIHLAARTEVEKSFYEPIDFSAINYVGTVNLIEHSKNLKNLKLFIFSSTMETYGAVPNYKEPFDEETPQFPNAPYAVAKVGCEYYLKYAARAYSFPFVALRQTNTYGRWDNDFFVVEQFITQMLKNPKEVNFGYKEPYRNFLHIKDLIDLYVTVLNKWKDARGHFFCTGPPNAIKINDLAKKIAEKIGWNGKINWNKKPKRVGEVYYLNSTHEKVKQVLGWQPKINLDDGLDEAIEIWRKNIQNTEKAEKKG